VIQSGPSRHSRSLDPESRRWIAELGADGSRRELALARLHEMLLRVARGEVARRAAHSRLSGLELSDLAVQAADDALLAIVRKLQQFRGESRFTTWAYKFAVLESASKVTRHAWRVEAPPSQEESWDRLPDRFSFSPEEAAELHEMFGLVRQVVDEELTPHQREIFVAIVLHDIPLDVLADRLQSNRNAIYKALFDARSKLRARLAGAGYLDAAQTGDRL
jgi:RNA polymerase sigma-70 factor (ECF subfamily)